MSARPEVGGWQPVGQIDLARLPATSLAQGAAALPLWLALQLPWYTISTPGATGSASAMVAGGWRWLIWLLSLATVVYLLLSSVTSWRDPSWLAERGRRTQVMAGIAALNFVLVLIAAFASKSTPPHIVPLPAKVAVGTAVGAYLAVVLALAVLVAAVMELLEATPGGWSRTTEPRSDAAATSPAPAAGPPPAGRAPGPPAPGSGSLDSPPRTLTREQGPASQGPAMPRRSPPQRPAEPGSGPPTGWMPPQPPPPPPL